MSSANDYWTGKLSYYKSEQWSTVPSLFAQEAQGYFPESGDVLELGGGIGQDSKWFAEKGYNVTMADLTEQRPPAKTVQTLVVDMQQPLPFAAHAFDVIYAHLSLHYFTEKRSVELFHEIYQTLRPGGILAFLVNSTADTEVNDGEELERNFRRVKGIDKRFFDLPFTQEMTEQFKVLLLDDKGTSYKDREMGLTQLIRFVGVKS